MNSSFVSQTDSIKSQVNDSDTDYCPDEEQPANDFDLHDIDENADKEERERCLLVYESTLLNLFKHCPKCGGDATAKEVVIKGSLFKVQIECCKGCITVWNSQPLIKSCKGMGNLDFTCAITLAGIPQAKFEKFAWLMNLKFVHNTTFYRQRKHFVQPVVKEVFVILNLIRKYSEWAHAVLLTSK